ncbi:MULTISPECIES: flagellar basal body rod protein FlgC [Acidiphilium]|jgi:flagellar basal-body rod protein FlgC|uniref:Flagellar basal-body rod protein FlgC n=2 Tax=Acidiphilium TaxID=522 RepID=A5G0F0_ACICJ|nr:MULTISPECIES: flagellar basal body rod protein FlgC [Acidiphilium]MBU6356172.1 flagellar basal body rod protein FlgC [Rhodospirillales bacterium]ABQ31332.1 flagellar basal-body rod protein FlgC [Acidiphilium cryptum JF-5]EGO94982.1 FlgC [Acidiphilium sp. PM]KDM67047.1 flagellar basal-body rod protein FlgC [Acidiphilium sp. JA12-A1]MBS3024553.1 flagellar basal body rod protein FlgC [Acidiphilium multivorum]
MKFGTTLDITAAGLSAQDARLQVIAQNLANADSTGSTPGSNPYQRKTISFQDVFSQTTGTDLVQVANIGKDTAPFPMKYDPSNPAANAQGYVKLPNVNSLVELMDMQQAERSYDANLSVMNATRGMMTRTLGLI